MTAPPPRYRYVYAAPIRHSVVRGNVCAATEAAERAKVTLVEVKCTN